MNIIINGEPKTVPDQATVAEILQTFKIVSETIVVEYNGTILQQHLYEGSHLTEGDRLEFIRFVGGG